MLMEQVKIQVDYEKAQAKRTNFQPTLTVYSLEAAAEMPHNMVRPAVIICPGGGYVMRSRREAEPIAMRYLAQGIHAFVLEYSVAPARYPNAALELAEAVRMVRFNAAKYHVDPAHIYISGFSAGGHLAATLGTLWNDPLFSKYFGENTHKDWKPNGMILCYPVLTMGKLTHEGSRDNLLGEDAPQQMLDQLSLEKRVTADTVPAFLWHTVEDGAVPVENSLLFATALQACKVPFEMHLYENGGHGLSLCDHTTASGPEHFVPDNAGWMDLAIQWVWRQVKRAQ